MLHNIIVQMDALPWKDTLNFFAIVKIKSRFVDWEGRGSGVGSHARKKKVRPSMITNFFGGKMWSPKECPFST